MLTTIILIGIMLFLSMQDKTSAHQINKYKHLIKRIRFRI